MTKSLEKSNSFERSVYRPEDFWVSLDTILSKKLTPEMIDSYAVDALDELTELVERTITEYSRQPTLPGDSARDTEDRAFAYFDLGEVEVTLDHVAELAESLSGIDEVIKEATVTNNVIVPPDYRSPAIERGVGSFKEKSLHNRLKTTLFIMQQDFDIDIRDSSQLLVTTGSTDGIMRGASYSLVETPALERCVLVCDEEGNATYVFDTSVASGVGIEASDLAKLSKQDLNDLIEELPGLGARFVYSGRFITHMKTHLAEAITPEADIEVEKVSSGSYLKKIEQASEGYKSVSGIAGEYGVDRQTVQRAIKELGDQLGSTTQARFGKVTTTAYSPEQQALIMNHINNHINR